MSDEADIMQVASEILDYMKKNPDAADTEEHIRNWWLSAREVECKRETVTNALHMLEQNEFIEHVELPEKRIAYRLHIKLQTSIQDGEQG